MDDVPMEIVQPASFPVTTLPGSPPSRQVLLKDLPQRVKKRAPECVVFCETLLGLLKAVHDAVLAHDDQWRVVFCDLVKRFLKMLGHKPLLKRLADGEVIAYTFREFNARVGDIFVGVGLNVERNLWAAEWERGCDYQATKLRELVSAAAPRMLIGEMRDVDQVTTAMLGMYSRLEGGTCGNLDALKRETLERLLRKLGLETRVITSETVTAVQQHPTSILSIFRWFIPERDVRIVGEEIGSGTCGVVNRAEWRHRDGSVQSVIVKTLYEERTSSELSLLKQLQFWYDLPQHRNIIKLYGGCHVAKKPFFVCEDAHGGDIVSFLGKEENRGMFWSLFLQVAEGLLVLHRHRIMHEGLKGSNILMGENNTPKISDFDCAYIRTLSASVSQKTEDAQANAVRWKAREKLVDASNALPDYKSDVYSLGMTMIEALTQAPPFKMDLEEDIVKNVIAGNPYERPEEASDEEWGVISRLIAVNIEDRPDTQEAIALIRCLVPAAEQTPAAA
ncbi:hypothetical protein PR003_g24270 [Phytophthora rubi]|uniref:Protein kinase domain-containing protein n=1 Tax=Phytophthora rubi TaxID=129364 RepID=A0A6A4CSF1_9STRA|nr:hypothetical protein PR002_g23410 [Phytophthora rubi]KAE8985194.1 hypothetical protein PR001_g22964 [Phytophthora rubi]KAE9294395.1 hypothetical protein PR003_g24270 [Phytophthora rubi]